MPEWPLLILKSASTSLFNLAPYVLVGVVLSEILKYIEWSDLLIQQASATPFFSIFWAVALGLVSPMCTYGTLPIVLTLFGLGFPVVSLSTFLVASSLMNPQLFIITWGGISPTMALYRLGAVAIFALLFGILLFTMNPVKLVNTALRPDQETKSKSKKSFTWFSFLKGSFQALQFVGFYIVVGVLLGAVVDVVIPREWLLQVFGGPEWLGILMGALLGIPFYACGGGTIPLIDAMLDKGMSAGAALAFFIVGPATRVTPLVALAAIIRPRVIGLLILLLLCYAVAIGLIINTLV
ncbi:permease [candidate division KSB1 bacterium]|nr:permease [candidate division KSB1 bacterium]